MSDLFAATNPHITDAMVANNRPLADALRPLHLSKVCGQEHLLGKKGSLSAMLSVGHVPSLILWGPPGCGKTTIARLIANEIGCHFDTVSAVTSGTAELKKLFVLASERQKVQQRTLLMVDEIHRFNRAQQDVFLPFIEDGTIILVGATTENPSFELNAALLSRCKVLVLNRLDDQSLLNLQSRAEKYTNKKLPLDNASRLALVEMADGDGRYMLGLCEELFALSLKNVLTPDALGKFLQQRLPVYDKHQDSHYNLISALHKSMRGSDVDAALYWLARMLQGGEDPLYIARRLVRFAVEDVGLADPQALIQANAAKEAFHFLGSPEGELAIVQAVIYLATAPKSNAVYGAFKRCNIDAKKHGSLTPPKHILNAPTQLMKEHGYGQGYQYDHDVVGGFSGQNYFPEQMARQSYYCPLDKGFERDISKRMSYWKTLREKKAL